jgi:hypothetical protein
MLLLFFEYYYSYGHFVLLQAEWGAVFFLDPAWSASYGDVPRSTRWAFWPAVWPASLARPLWFLFFFLFSSLYFVLSCFHRLYLGIPSVNLPFSFTGLTLVYGLYQRTPPNRQPDHPGHFPVWNLLFFSFFFFLLESGQVPHQWQKKKKKKKESILTARLCRCHLLDKAGFRDALGDMDYRGSCCSVIEDG